MREQWWRRIRRYFDESPLVLASGLTLLCVPAIVALAWVLTGRWEDMRIEEAIHSQTIQLERQLSETETNFEVTFTEIRNIANWIAEEGHSLSAIQKSGAGSEENMFLHGVAASFGIDLIHVMNADGLSVAASNWSSPTSTVGTNYSDREYFQEAMSGIPGRQFVAGRTTKVPGFYFSMPVRLDDEVAGIVAVKFDQARLQNLIRITDSIVSDDHGVVVLSENPSYMFNVVPDATVNELSVEQRMKAYERKEFQLLPLQPAGPKMAKHPEIMLLDNRPVLIGIRNLLDIGLTVRVVSNFAVLDDVQRQRYFIFGTSAAIAVLSLWGIWVTALYFMRTREYRRQLEVANRQLSKLNEDLQEQATRDYLTGILNRRAFSDLLATELERLKRYGGDLCLAVIDIDHFKHINDSRGHAVGDVALKFLVDAVSAQMRRTDVFARVGGEEFALLMPNTHVAEAVQVLDRMRQAVFSMPVSDLEPSLRMTFSAGVTGWRPGVSERTLMHAADEALYAAKNSGRNRVVADEGD